MLIECTREGLEAAIEQIASDAHRRAGDASFPGDGISALASVGALGITVHGSTSVGQWSVVRSVAAADAVCGRILERHLEAVDRLFLQAPEPLRSDELDAVASGERVLGVWDGGMAELRPGGDGLTLHGALDACVGAGGIDAVVVPARELDGAPVLALADASARVEVDRTWAATTGLPPSAGHRATLHGARVTALLRPIAPDDERAVRNRAGLRRAATWAGMVDGAAEAALDGLALMGGGDDRIALAAGRIAVAQRTMDLWLSDAGRLADTDPSADLETCVARVRAAVTSAAHAVLGESADTIGTPHAGPLARARRELCAVPGVERPDPAVVSAGREALRGRRP